MKDRVMLVERIRAVKKTRGPVPIAAAAQLSLAACDPYYLMDPVNILEKLPKDFYKQVEEKKWQLRGEALDKLLELVKAPKILPGDFDDLTRVLKKFISKETNVTLVTKVLLVKFQMMWLSKFLINSIADIPRIGENDRGILYKWARDGANVLVGGRCLWEDITSFTVSYKKMPGAPNLQSILKISKGQKNLLSMGKILATLDFLFFADF